MDLFCIVSVTVWFLHLQVGRTITGNIAFCKPVIQSSTYRDHVAERTMDGNYNQNVVYCSLNYEVAGHSWWMIDLLHVYKVEDIVINNRDSYMVRLDHINIEGYLQYPLLCPNSSSQSCASHPGPSGVIVNITCAPGFQARYLKLNFPNRRALCEVEMYGPKVETKDCTCLKIHMVSDTSLNNASEIIANTQNRLPCAVQCQNKLTCLVFSYNAVTNECLVQDGLMGLDETLSVTRSELFVEC